MMKTVKRINRIVKKILQGETEQYRFLLAERVSNFIYTKYKFSEYNNLMLEDTNFINKYRQMEQKNGKINWHSLDRKYNLNQLVKATACLDGDTAECGAYKGGSSWFICENIKEQNKKHHIFDSFAGLSEPLQSDGVYWLKGDMCAAEHEIERTLKKFDFVKYYKGWIPERFFQVAEKKFSFVHIDVDLYQPH